MTDRRITELTPATLPLAGTEPTVVVQGGETRQAPASEFVSASQSRSANTFLAAPNGSAGAPTFRAIVAADVPTLNQNTTGSAATLTTSRNFSISGGGITASAVGFNGSAAVVLNASVDAGHITLARMANLAANSIIGNNTGSAATPVALTTAQTTAMLDLFSSALKGLVPASGGGTTNFLRADGTWAAPPGSGGGGTTTNAVTFNNGGAGAASGTTFDGSAARTISYNTIGAARAGAITAGDLTMATARLLGRTTAAPGAVEELTAAAARTFLNVADGASANSTDAALRDRATHTGTQAASTISDFNSAARAETEAMLVAGTNVTLTPSGSGATRQITIAASGGGGGSALGLWDYWEECWFGSNNVASPQYWVGTAISSGTNTTAVPTTAMAGYNRNGVFLRSSTTANGGFRYQTSSVTADYFGVISHKFRCAFRWLTPFFNTMVRIGYHDTTTSADATDGAYFEINAGLCTAKTANNNTRTTNATDITLSINVDYTFDIEVNAAGTEVRFRIYSGTNETPIFDVTNTTNIPTTSARGFGSGIVATESTTTASDIGILYMLGEGSIAAFNRARG